MKVDRSVYRGGSCPPSHPVRALRLMPRHGGHSAGCARTGASARPVTRRASVISYFFIFLIVFLAGCQEKPLYKDTCVMMGTYAEVISDDERAAEIAFGEMSRIEKLASKYDPDSEISKLNKNGSLIASPEIFSLIEKSLEFWRATDGAFDITVGPLMDIWGFKDKNFRVPSRKQIKETLKKVGSDKIILNKANNLVQLKLSGMEIDLGGMAKGYAVDCAIKKLKAAGVKNCLVCAGGSIFCLGQKSGQPWKVAVKDPRVDKFLATLDLTAKGVDTSGDYEQFFVKDGVRFSHIMNPLSGYPADSGVISATIISGDCLTADIMATAVCVLGSAKGRLAAKKFPQIETIIIKEENASRN